MRNAKSKDYPVKAIVKPSERKFGTYSVKRIRELVAEDLKMMRNNPLPGKRGHHK